MNAGFMSQGSGRRPASVPIGRRFGLLTVIDEAPRMLVGPLKRQRRAVYVRCDCGKEIVAELPGLIAGSPKSCGCARYRSVSEKLTRHGMTNTRTYHIWNSMVSRCTNPNSKSWARYGGRGIRVCDRWRTFDHFHEDMGTAPEGLSIDRIDNAKGYEPGNCRWANAFEQAVNKRSTRLITALGKTLALSQWGRETGLGSSVIRDRLSCGWAPDDAMSIPLGGSLKRSQQRIKRGIAA